PADRPDRERRGPVPLRRPHRRAVPPAGRQRRGPAGQYRHRLRQRRLARRSRPDRDRGRELLGPSGLHRRGRGPHREPHLRRQPPRALLGPTRPAPATAPGAGPWRRRDDTGGQSCLAAAMSHDLTRRRIMAGVVAGVGAAIVAPPARAVPPSPVVRTRAGPMRGFTADGVQVFRGVRYGADTAARRFRPPAPPAPWTEVREAVDYGPASPQRGAEPNQSEDCLFLNVWTPGLDAARRPVMVYVHGGAYATGSGSSPLYDGARLARRNEVVVVTVNHRLNLFGYAYLARLAGDPFADSGNAGQLDLILALRWVRANIAAFGGDPERVMVFGQSGGGAK